LVTLAQKMLIQKLSMKKSRLPVCVFFRVFFACLCFFIFLFFCLFVCVSGDPCPGSRTASVLRINLFTGETISIVDTQSQFQNFFLSISNSDCDHKTLTDHILHSWLKFVKMEVGQCERFAVKYIIGKIFFLTVSIFFRIVASVFMCS